MQVMAPLSALWRKRRVVLHERPHLRRGSQNILEPAWQHADYGIELVVECDLAPDDRAVAAKAPPPQRIADDRHIGAVQPVIGWIEVTPQRRRDTQHAEVTRAHLLSIESFRLSRPGHRRLPELHHRERVEGATPRRPTTIRAERLAGARAICG